MATSTFVPIATQTLGSAAASITFSSITGIYTDLRLVLTGTVSVADVGCIQYNADTGTNYSYTQLYGNGTTASSANNTTNGYIRFGGASNMSTTIPSMITTDIFSYAGATNKTSLTTCAEDFNGSGDVMNLVGLWRSTAAITSIKLYLQSGNNFATGTIATLWGI